MSAEPLPADYAERVYAGWLGKCIGVRLGAPVENWTHQEIRDTLGEVRDFLPLPPGKLFKPDDDTAFPLVLLRAVEDFGLDATAEQIGETVLNYLGDQRGTLWWGGYGVSTEHTAYLNLAAGIPAPLSGSAALNGRTVAEQIGGQIFSDIWGLIAPNEPERAAEWAARAASVSHDGEALLGARFIAGLVSTAFGQPDPRRLVERGLALLDAGSEYAHVVRAVCAFHDAHPADWRACIAYLHEQFGYDRYHGVVHIIPNAGVVVMALLYGGGDFSRSVQIATMAGWDTDCNAGNVGCILGVAVGLEGIEARWRAPMNDLLVGASLLGARNLTDIPTVADRLVHLGAQAAGESIPARARLHFDYPGSSHGAEADARLAEITLHAEQGSLALHLRGLKKKGEASAWFRTYCRPRDLSANYYGASFSPTIWPGQTVTARLWVPPGATELYAALFVWDDNAGAQHQAQALRLVPGAWNALTYAIPPLRDALLARVGVTLRTLGEAWSGTLLLDDLNWAGAPSFSTDFALERPEYGALSQWTFLRGFWRKEGREKDSPAGYHGTCASVGETYTGDPAWGDLRLAAEIVPLAGEHHNVLVRVQGARRSYVAGLAPGGRLALYKNQGGYCEVAAAPLEWRTGELVTLEVTATGPEIAVAAAGETLLRWRDDDAPYLTGQIGLGTAHGSHTCCTRLAVEGSPA